MNTGLSVKQHQKSWFVQHDASRLPAGPNLRLRRHAEANMADLYATGVDFTQTSVQKDPALKRAGTAVSRWKQRADNCCADGEHYSPYTYRNESGRCI
jgi:hypothetical protein